MRILLVNDDGVNAPGIAAAFHSLVKLPGTHVSMVAPLEEKSTTGHSLSLSHPLRLVKVEEDRYGISGFPADCVLMGLGAVCNPRPDLVVSGINRGGNMGQDLYYSGTVAGAREAAFHRIPAIAVSLVVEFSKIPAVPQDYDLPAEFIRDLVGRGVHEHIPPLHLLNINFPFIKKEEIKGLKISTVGFRKYSDKVQRLLDPRSREYFWVLGQYEGYAPVVDSDCWCLDHGYISLSLVGPTDMQGEVSPGLKKIVQEINHQFSL